MRSALEIARPALVVETDAHEGPVYAGDEHALYFTTVRRERVAIKRLDLAGGEVDVLRADANNANGMTLGPDGRLVVCEQGSLAEPARIALVDRATGAAETLVEGGLSSPNDVVVARDGSVWFTDPTYGRLQGFRPPPEHPDRVYRLDPATGELDVVTEALDKPNGLAFSPDERTLYAGDNGRPHHLLALDPATGEGRVLATFPPEHPDGLKVDAGGRIYASARHGVQILEPDGRLAAEIPLPGAVNFAFGRDERVLYVTADTAVWAVDLP